MKSCLYILAVITLLLHAQCRKESGASSLNCEKFHSAFEAMDVSRLKIQLDALSSSVGEIPQGSGMQGISEKVEKLISRINNSHCSVTANPQYFTIDTYPPLAEIRFTSSLSNNSYSLDFRLNEGHIVEFINIHE